MALRFEDGALFEWILPTLNDQRRDQFYYQPLRRDLCEDVDKASGHVVNLAVAGLLGLPAARACPPTAALTVKAVNMSPVMTHLTRHLWASKKISPCPKW